MRPFLPFIKASHYVPCLLFLGAYFFMAGLCVNAQTLETDFTSQRTIAQDFYGFSTTDPFRSCAGCNDPNLTLKMPFFNAMINRFQETSFANGCGWIEGCYSAGSNDLEMESALLKVQSCLLSYRHTEDTMTFGYCYYPSEI